MNNLKDILIMKNIIFLLNTVFLLVLSFSTSIASDFIKMSVLDVTTKYLFNRNSIKDFKIFENNIVALTSSGNILKFDLNTLKQTGELIDSVRFSCLGDIYDDKILIGRKDGTILLMNPKDLSLNRINKINSEPYYIVTIFENINNKHHIVCISFIRPSQFNWNDTTNIPSYSGGKTIFTNLTNWTEDTIEIKANQFWGQSPSTMTKTKDNLIYFGKDVGEFGGYYGYYNYKTREIKGFGTNSEGCYGFINVSNNKTYTFGGTNHMGCTSSIIYEIAGIDTVLKYSSPFHNWNFQKQTNVSLKNSPKEPINIILENKFKNTLFVFTGNYIFETDYDFINWKLLYELKLRYKWGRPDAVGDYPAITNAVVLDSNIILCSTVRDGFLLLNNNTSDYYSIPNQLPYENYNEIIFYRNKYIFHEKSNNSSPYLYNEDEFRHINVFPSINNSSDDWCFAKLINKNDSLFSFTQECSGNRSLNFNVVELDTVINISSDDNNKLYFRHIFKTFDEKIWCIDDSDLYHFNNIKWQKIGLIKGWENLNFNERGCYYKVLNNEKPWIIIDDRFKIAILEYTKDSLNLTFKSRYLVDDDTLKIYDGCLYNHFVLLLTQKGIYKYDILNNILTIINLEMPDSTINLMCSDSKGRLWLGGDNLYMVEFSEEFVVSKVNKISLISNEIIGYLNANKYGNGIIVLIYGRGVYFIE